MELREYQTDVINKARQSLAKGRKRICIVLPCGAGKSVIAANIAKISASKGNHVLFFVHRIELVRQIRQTFIECGVDMDYCTVGMQQTIVRHLDQVNNPKLIIVDEAHHILANGYKKIINTFPDAVVCGFTATPLRMNEGGLGEIIDELITSVSTKWLIENNYLSPCKCYSVQLADLSNIRIKRGEYDAGQMADILEDNAVYGKTVENYKLIAEGRKCLVYTVSVESAKQTADLFIQNGYTAASLDSKTPIHERARIMREFRENKITILCNCELFGEGLDVPDVECVILLRKTHSLTLYIQQSMRSMRYKPGKTAVIIDHVGNVFEHGLPHDDREWTLDPKKRKRIAEKKEPTYKTCPNCSLLLLFNVRVCPDCGYEFWEKIIQHTIDVALQEITEADLLRKKPYCFYRACKTWDELERFRAARKYKQAWSIYSAIELGVEIPEEFKYLESGIRSKLAVGHG